MTDLPVVEKSKVKGDGAVDTASPVTTSQEPLKPLEKRTGYTAELSNSTTTNPDILISRFLNSGIISREEAKILSSKSPEEKLKYVQEILKSDEALKKSLRLGSELGIVPQPLDMRIRHASNTVTYDLPKGSPLIRFSLEERNIRGKEIEALAALVKDGAISASEAKALISDGANLTARTSRLEKYKQIAEKFQAKTLTAEAAATELKGLLVQVNKPSTVANSNVPTTKVPNTEPGKIPPIVNVVSRTPVNGTSANTNTKKSDYVINNTITPGTFPSSMPKSEIDSKIEAFHELITKRLIAEDPLLAERLKGIPLTFNFHPDLNKLEDAKPDAHTQGLSESTLKDNKLISASITLNPALLNDPAKAFLTVHHELTHIARVRDGVKDTKLVDEQKTTQHSLEFLRKFGTSLANTTYSARFLSLLAQEDIRLKNDVPKLYR